MHTTTVAPDLDDPYRESILAFFGRSFPSVVANSAATLDGVTAAFIASGQIRLGPTPNPEALVAIRDVLRTWIELDQPIPVLTIWGSKKASNDHGIDIAEVSGLKTIRCLDERVRRFYMPGIQVRMRVEDLSGWVIFEDEGVAARRSSDNYVRDMMRLTRIMAGDIIKPVLESSIMDEKEYRKRSNTAFRVIRAYLSAVEAGEDAMADLGHLRDIGWKGTIPQEQRDFYKGRYKASFPGISEQQIITKMAWYFACSLARYQMHGLGDDPSWGGKHIVLSFVPPIPGMPEALTSKRIYYRTLPENLARTHIPPWRARGYLKINGHAIPKLATWHEPLVVHEASTVISNDIDSVRVSTPYVVAP